MPKNDTNNHKISSTPKPIKEQEYKNSFRKKLWSEYIIISQPKNQDLVYPYIDLEKHLLN